MLAYEDTSQDKEFGVLLTLDQERLDWVVGVVCMVNIQFMIELRTKVAFEFCYMNVCRFCGLYFL